MRWLALSIFLCGFTPIASDHDSTEKVNQEFRNIENSLINDEVQIYSSTPTLREVKDGSVFIIKGSSYTTWSSLMWRSGQEIYRVVGSCVTIVR